MIQKEASDIRLSWHRAWQMPTNLHLVPGKADEEQSDQ